MKRGPWKSVSVSASGETKSIVCIVLSVENSNGKYKSTRNRMPEMENYSLDVARCRARCLQFFHRTTEQLYTVFQQ